MTKFCIVEVSKSSLGKPWRTFRRVYDEQEELREVFDWLADQNINYILQIDDDEYDNTTVWVYSIVIRRYAEAAMFRLRWPEVNPGGLAAISWR